MLSGEHRGSWARWATLQISTSNRSSRSRWRHGSTGRVVCLGDAAHAPSSLAGMGTSLAITGAYVLAGELAKLSPGEHPTRAFKAYGSTFRPFVEKTQKVPSFVPDIAHPQTAFKRWLVQTLIAGRSRAVSWALAIPWLARKFDEIDDEDFPLRHIIRPLTRLVPSKTERVGR